jgi:hypothetical protein
VPRGNPCLGHMAPPYSSMKTATCQLGIGKHLPPSQQPYLPRVPSIVCHMSPYMLLYATCYHTVGPCGTYLTMPRQLYGHAMCHPFSGDTCHLLFGPPVPATSPVCMTCHVNTDCSFHVSFHVALYGLYNHLCFCMFGKMNIMRYWEHTTSV